MNADLLPIFGLILLAVFTSAGAYGFAALGRCRHWGDRVVAGTLAATGTIMSAVLCLTAVLP
jgi:hypothetical protein